MKIILLCLLLSATAFAGEKGNGGLGVKCTGRVFTLDYYEKFGQKSEDKDQFFTNDYLDKINERLRQFDERFAALFQEALIEIGPLKSWSPGKLNYHIYDSYRFGPDLRPGCSLILLAENKGGKVSLSKEHASSLSPLQKRILHLHEALYQVGFKHFSHTNSIYARKLTILLMDRNLDLMDSFRIRAFLKEFKHPGDASPQVTSILGTYKLTHFVKDQAHCPDKWAMDVLSSHDIIFATEGGPLFPIQSEIAKKGRKKVFRFYSQEEANKQREFFIGESFNPYENSSGPFFPIKNYRQRILLFQKVSDALVDVISFELSPDTDRMTIFIKKGMSIKERNRFTSGYDFYDNSSFHGRPSMFRLSTMADKEWFDQLDRGTERCLYKKVAGPTEIRSLLESIR